MKKLITPIIALTMIISMVGCGAEIEKSSENDSVIETTMQEINENYSLDSTCIYHDISFPVYSGWKNKVNDEVLTCPKSGGLLTLSFDEYDTKEICNQMFEFHAKTFKELGSSTPESIDVNGIAVSKFYWKPNGGYENSYIFEYNNCIYKIEFYASTEHYKSCKMFKESDEIIKAMQLSGIKANVEASEKNSLEESTEPNDKEKEESSKETKETKPVETETEEKTVDNVSLGMKNALSSAKDYLDYSSFSYSGLIEQLEYEKYTHEEAVYAAENCGADWNEQAALTAQSYMDYSSFSRQELIDQLIFEGFTEEQAEYGVKAVGY